MDAEEQLQALDALRRDGILTDADVTRAKRRIFRRSGGAAGADIPPPPPRATTPKQATPRRRGFLEWVNQNMLKEPVDWGHVWSYDWCRYRRDSNCYYSDQVDKAATREAGYAVVIPVERGVCWRNKWDDQKECPAAEPGPNSGEEPHLVDATTSWARGGQRGGVPGTVAVVLSSSEQRKLPNSRNPREGWKPDPMARHDLRYWVKSGWTQWVCDGSKVSRDDL